MAFDEIPRDIRPIFLFLSTEDSYRFATASGESVDRERNKDVHSASLTMSRPL